MGSYIYGVQPVLELLRRRPHQVEQISLSREPFHSEEILKLATEAKIKVKYLLRSELDRITGSREHQGVAAMAPLPEAIELEEVLNRTKAKENSLLIFLDQIEDPQNLGAIIRTAEGAGADAVIVPEHKSARITPAVLKASAGALEWIPFCIVTNLARALTQIKEHGFWIYAAHTEAEMSLWQTEFSAKAGIIIGSEGKGIRPLVLKSADFAVRIPLSGKIQSLNASVSAAIMMYEYVRQRSAK